MLPEQIKPLFLGKVRSEGGNFYIAYKDDQHYEMFVIPSSKDPKKTKVMAEGRKMRQELGAKKFASGEITFENGGFKFEVSAGGSLQLNKVKTILKDNKAEWGIPKLTVGLEGEEAVDPDATPAPRQAAAIDTVISDEDLKALKSLSKRNNALRQRLDAMGDSEDAASFKELSEGLEESLRAFEDASPEEKRELYKQIQKQREALFAAIETGPPPIGSDGRLTPQGQAMTMALASTKRVMAAQVECKETVVAATKIPGGGNGIPDLFGLNKKVDTLRTKVRQSEMDPDEREEWETTIDQKLGEKFRDAFSGIDRSLYKSSAFPGLESLMQKMMANPDDAEQRRKLVDAITPKMEEFESASLAARLRLLIAGTYAHEVALIGRFIGEGKAPSGDDWAPIGKELAEAEARYGSYLVPEVQRFFKSILADPTILKTEAAQREIAKLGAQDPQSLLKQD